jgi:DNA topoisomerase-1
MKLVVVESPNKCKKIGGYLGEGFRVVATVGHFRDLPPDELAVDVESMTPTYAIDPEKREVVQRLKAAAAKASEVLIATDPDREGEAIGWHLAEMLGMGRAKTHRILFNEITGRAVKEAFRNPGKIDTNKVDAQQARRVLDRLVGYKLSPLLWEKIRRGLSAGRVQSVAVRLIAEREREIREFVPEEYWSLHARLRSQPGPEFTASLREIRGEKAKLACEADTVAVMTGLHGQPWVVRSVTRGERRRNPAAPFTTSTLQQEASRRLRFTAKKTMMLAQQLYEGIELGDEGAVGLITYMRTDAVRVAREAQDEARAWVTARFGREYLPDTPPAYRSKKGAQEAHEAIRPTGVERDPKATARFLSKDQAALYRLIWERFIASQMVPALYDTVAADIAAGDCLFRAQGSTLRFAGFTAVYVESREGPEVEEEAEAVVPALTEGERLKLLGLDPKQHFTQPPPRYTEASLVKILEERGIGRPSTYAQILSTIQDRGYVRREKGTLYPTDLGLQVTDMLVPHFPEVMDVEFTAQLEESLDRIEEGEAGWVETVKDFYREFEKDLKRASKKMEDYKGGVKTGEDCPECGEPLVEKWGRFGKFLACSAYPGCKYTKDLGGEGRQRIEDQPTDEICPTCGKPMVVKHGRFGKFIACSGYPECKTTKPVTIGIACPERGCSGQIVERRSKRGRTFYACSEYPQCTFSLWLRPVAEPCPRCAAPFLTERMARGGKRLRACFRAGCDYKQEVAPA